MTGQLIQFGTKFAGRSVSVTGCDVCLGDRPKDVCVDDRLLHRPDMQMARVSFEPAVAVAATHQPFPGTGHHFLADVHHTRHVVELHQAERGQRLVTRVMPEPLVPAFFTFEAGQLSVAAVQHSASAT